MDDFCDSKLRGGAFSFEHIGRMEAIRTSEALQDIDRLLLTRIAPIIAVKDATTNEMESSSGDYYRHVESIGYDAHCERVDQKEIESWQNAFSYFEIKGQSMEMMENDRKTSTSETEDNFCSFSQHQVDRSIDTANLSQSLNCNESYAFSSTVDLSIEGIKITIPKIPCLDDNYYHGILEELIAVDAHPNSGDTEVDSKEIFTEDMSPYSSRVEEIISLLFDTVWPEIVDALRPLVLRVVQVSHEIGINYEDDQKNSDCISNDGDEKMSVDSAYASW